ncbi:MAG: hypothetical protein JST16_05155 [Bdellovibrionales bacterium]|nr:hypothetical protein [Bdellovibrionales bacterium]
MLNEIKKRLDVQDEEFDSIFPSWVSTYSARHWTPLSVARRAAGWLASKTGSRVLDVGAGPGKFCLVGAATTKGIFVGVEQRRALHDVARGIADSYALDRAKFALGNAMDFDWRSFDGIYLYNPFAEHIFEADERIDTTPAGDLEPIEWSGHTFNRYGEETYAKLSQMKLGTRVATFHGYGKAMPAGYSMIYRSPSYGQPLFVWERQR